MKKNFLFITLLIPMLIFCAKPQQTNDDSNDGGDNNSQEESYRDPVFERNPADPADEILTELPPEIKDGDIVQVTRDYIEKFLTEVKYEDGDFSGTRIYDYPGGYNDKNATELGPVTNADKPALYTIRWSEDASAGDLTLTLKDGDWSRDYKIASGESSQIITNLRPNASYTYVVTGSSGKEMTHGSFTTTGSIHQCFFPWNVRNCRDLGGWKTYDGKTVKYRKIYRGGRMEGSTMSPEGRQEILAEGIKAQLDLRGKSDMLHWGVLGKDSPFANPCIEQGGYTMLGADKEKTKQCFDFTLNCLKENKPVYFHCSLGRDRTGTFAALVLGILGVPEGDITQEYELSYFAPVGWSIAYSEKNKYFKNTRLTDIKSVVNYFKQKGESTDRFDVCVEKYLLWIGVPQADIDEFRRLMLD